MTLLRLSYKNEKRIECGTQCHNSPHPKISCRCICAGVFHAIQEGSEDYRNALAVHGPRLIASLGEIGVDVSGLQTALGGPLFAEHQKAR